MQDRQLPARMGVADAVGEVGQVRRVAGRLEAAHEAERAVEAGGHDVPGRAARVGIAEQDGAEVERHARLDPRVVEHDLGRRAATAGVAEHADRRRRAGLRHEPRERAQDDARVVDALDEGPGVRVSGRR